MWLGRALVGGSGRAGGLLKPLAQLNHHGYLTINSQVLCLFWTARWRLSSFPVILRFIFDACWLPPPCAPSLVPACLGRDCFCCTNAHATKEALEMSFNNSKLAKELRGLSSAFARCI